MEVYPFGTLPPGGREGGGVILDEKRVKNIQAFNLTHDLLWKRRRLHRYLYGNKLKYMSTEGVFHLNTVHALQFLAYCNCLTI